MYTQAAQDLNRAVLGGVLRHPEMRNSGWKFVTSSSVGGGGCTDASALLPPGVRNFSGSAGRVGIYVGGQGGMLVAMDPSGVLYSLDYGVASGGASIGTRLFPVPASMSVSLRRLPSTGIGEIWMGPAVGESLSSRDFLGPCTIVEFGVGFIAGAGIELVICGTYFDSPLSGMLEGAVGIILGAAAPFTPLLAAAFARTYRCAGLLTGMQVTSPGGSFIVHKGAIRSATAVRFLSH